MEGGQRGSWKGSCERCLQKAQGQPAAEAGACSAPLQHWHVLNLLTDLLLPEVLLLLVGL
jgi:hypothetical protein